LHHLEKPQDRYNRADFVHRARLESASESVRDRIGRIGPAGGSIGRPCRFRAPLAHALADERHARAMNAARSLLQNGGLVDGTGLRRTLLLTGCDCK